MNVRIVNYCDRAIEICLYLVIFFLPFAKAGVEICVWMAIFLWLLKRIFGYRIEGPWGVLPQTPLNKALVTFLVINALATFFSTNLGLSFRAFFGKILKFVFLYFMVIETITSEKRSKIFFNILLLSATLIMADSVFQYFKGTDFLRGYGMSRLAASFPSSNDFAGWIIMLIPILGAGLLTKRVKIFSWRMKIIAGVLLILMSFCLLLTYSRGAWLGLLVSLFLGMLYIIKTSQLKIRRGLVLALIFFVIVFGIGIHYFKATIRPMWNFTFKSGQPIGERIKSIVQIREGSALIRARLWQEALRVIEDFPLLGSGLNTYSRVAPYYKISKDGGTYPHNSFLQMAAETGVLGLLSFLWILFEFFKSGIHYLSLRKDYLALGFLCGIVAFLVQSFVDTNLYALQMVVLFWFMLGLTTAVINLESKEVLRSS